jgi:hypothetical protein
MPWGAAVAITFTVGSGAPAVFRETPHPVADQPQPERVRQTRTAIRPGADAGRGHRRDDRGVTYQSDTLRRSHRQLLAAAESLRMTGEALRHAVPHERQQLLARALRVLHDEVLPHVERDEKAIYPELTRTPTNGRLLSAMELEHEAIRSWIDELAEVSVDDERHHEAERLLFGLHALISVHVWKEEHLFKDALETVPWPAGGTP